MSKLDEIFEYKIGDVVRCVNRIDDENQFFLTINQRALEECPGGIQYHYLCRALHEGGIGLQNFKLGSNELETCDYKAEMAKAKMAKEQRELEDLEKSMRMREEIRAKMKEARENKR